MRTNHRRATVTLVPEKVAHLATDDISDILQCVYCHCCPGKNAKVPLTSQYQCRYGIFASRGLTLKPVRAGQGIGRGIAQRNHCKRKSQSSINPVRGDRLCVNNLLPPRWDLDVCAQLLQGFHSASPRYTPAYALAAPNGAFSGHQ